MRSERPFSDHWLVCSSLIPMAAWSEAMDSSESFSSCFVV